MKYLSKSPLLRQGLLVMLLSVPFGLVAQVSTVPNNSALGTVQPPTAFPNPTVQTAPPNVVMPPPGNAAGMALQTQPGYNPGIPNPTAPQVQNYPGYPEGALQGTPDRNGLAATPSPTPCIGSAYGQSCVQ